MRRNKIVLIFGEEQDPHVIAVSKRLQHIGIEIAVLNSNLLAQNGVLFTPSTISIGEHSVEDLGNIGSIWVRGMATLKLPNVLIESQAKYIRNQWAELLHGLYQHLGHKKWVSNPNAMRVAGNKLQQILIAKKYFDIPEIVVTNIPAQAMAFCIKHQNNVVLKTLTSGGFLDNNGVAKTIPTTRIKEETIASGFAGLEQTPVILQKYISRKIELRTFVIGHKAYTISMRVNGAKSFDDIRTVNPSLVEYQKYKPGNRYTNACISLVKATGLRFAAIDVIKDTTDKYYFLDLNPMGQFLVYEENAGIDISGKIAILLARD